MGKNFFRKTCLIAVACFVWRVLGLSFFGSLSAFAAIDIETGASAAQFATENSTSSKYNLGIHWFSKDFSSNKIILPKRELEVHSFFESGKSGDYSFDADPVLFRFPIATGSNSHIWFGRTHPFVEDGEGSVSPTSAVGSSWVQNQSDALSPRVAGWPGIGGRIGFSGALNLTVGWSPVFLPSFGPTLKLSESDEVSGSRFSRLPPRYVKVGGARLPLRYRVETGDLMDLVFQHQGYAGLSLNTQWSRFKFFAWSAPNPNPSLDANAKVKVNAKAAHVLVTAEPSFHRQIFTGARWEVPVKYVRPAAETVYEHESGDLKISGNLTFFDKFQIGALHTLTQEKAEASLLPSPRYDKDLIWAEAWGYYFKRKFRPSLRYEKHFTDDAEGSWIRPRADYFFSETFNLFGTISLLTGQDTSYFGAWRDLDSVTLGATYTW
jgi:hypothetical protein